MARHSAVADYYRPKLAQAFRSLQARASGTVDLASVLSALRIDGWIAGIRAAASVPTLVVGDLDPAPADWAPGWGETADLGVDAPSALSSLIADARQYAANIPASGASGQDPDVFADRVAGTQAATAAEAAAQAAYASNDVAQWNFIAEAGACADCLNMESASPWATGDDGPPVHDNCGCESEPVVTESRSHDQRTSRMAKGEPVGLTSSIKSQFVKDLADTSTTWMTDEDWRANMSTAEINDLPDSDFAYIEPGGKKDEGGKTVPRSLRHYPIQDKAHVRNALARAAAAIAGDNEEAKAIAEKAMPAIKAAAKKMGIGEEANAKPTPCPTCDGTGKIREGHVTCPDCGGSGEVTEKKSGPVVEYRRRKAAQLRGLERRSFGVEQFELREDTASGMLRFRGYACLTETPYDVGPFTETVRRSAFKRTLSENPDVQLVLNHGNGGSGMPIARTGINMVLQEDQRGLLVDADLDPEDTDVQQLNRKMKRGLVDQMSFAFQVTDQDWSDDFSQRTIRSVSIHRGDVSVVNQGASPTTVATIRSTEVIQAIRRLGYDAFRDALCDWRGYTLLPIARRDKSTLDPHTVEVLSEVLRAFQAVDDSADEGIPLLADLLGVPDPNTAASHNPDGSPKRPTVDPVHRSAAPSLRTVREWSALRQRPAVRARTPVAVITDPLGKQVCPMCNGNGTVKDEGSQRNCKNCAGKGWVRKAS